MICAVRDVVGKEPNASRLVCAEKLLYLGDFHRRFQQRWLDARDVHDEVQRVGEELRRVGWLLRIFWRERDLLTWNVAGAELDVRLVVVSGDDLRLIG